jgi:hypothetical protein
MVEDPPSLLFERLRQRDASAEADAKLNANGERTNYWTY